MTHTFIRISILSALCLVTACEDNDTSGGTAPSVDNLTLQKANLDVGKNNMVQGSLGFVDPDGDVDHLLIELELSGTVSTLPPTPVVGAAGLTMGAIPFVLSVTPGVAGPVLLRIRAVDSAGLSSQVLTATLTAE